MGSVEASWAKIDTTRPPWTRPGLLAGATGRSLSSLPVVVAQEPAEAGPTEKFDSGAGRSSRFGRGKVIRPRVMGKTPSRSARAKPLKPSTTRSRSDPPPRAETQLAAAPMATTVLCVGLCVSKGALY